MATLRTLLENLLADPAEAGLLDLEATQAVVVGSNTESGRIAVAPRAPENAPPLDKAAVLHDGLAAGLALGVLEAPAAIRQHVRDRAVHALDKYIAGGSSE